MRKLISFLVVVLIGVAVASIGKDFYEKGLEKDLRNTATKFMDEYSECDVAGMATFIPKNNNADWDDDLYKLVENYAKANPHFVYTIEYVELYDGKINPSFKASTGVNDEIKRVADVCVKISATVQDKTYEKTAYLYMGLINGEWKLVLHDYL